MYSTAFANRLEGRRKGGGGGGNVQYRLHVGVIVHFY